MCVVVLWCRFRDLPMHTPRPKPTHVVSDAAVQFCAPVLAKCMFVVCLFRFFLVFLLVVLVCLLVTHASQYRSALSLACLVRCVFVSLSISRCFSLFLFVLLCMFLLFDRHTPKITRRIMSVCNNTHENTKPKLTAFGMCSCWMIACLLI